ncbi:MAG: aminopeptidase P family N-terminal domain-containing protein, partial [Bacteroidales bacterium]|nr:aminopeptidase P family N-terminal domain-containing protein [Bacteroidales bacterium]
MTSSVQKLALLRAAMIRNGIDVYILPSSDPHLGEYIPDHWKIVPWLTGFTGSAATVVITNEFAGLFTDSRYFIQAQNELADSGIILVKPEPFKAPDYVDWLYKIIARSSRIGFDGKIISVAQYRRMENKLKDRDISYNTDCDLITDIWNERPPMPDSEASDHPVKYSGIDRSAKISRVREQMKQQLIDVHLLTSPDDIMWLLNIRGSDLAYSPLLSSFALISDSRLLFFTESKKVPNELSEEFSRLGIEMHPYNEITGFLSTLRENSSILITPVTTSVKLFNSIPGKLRITEDISIPCRLKAIRNKTEIENTGRVMIKDGVALTKFFYWFEQNLGREV